MDKKHKQHRKKTPTRDEMDDNTPRGTSFDTAAGRAAQGMRRDIAKGGGDTVGNDEGEEDDEEEGRVPGDETEGAVGASDANSGGGAAAGIPDADTAERTGGRVNKGDPEADREKLFPDSKPKRESNE